MGRRGPRPAPVEIKILRGNPGKRPLNLGRPQPPLGAVCPKWLAREAKREWKRLAPYLESVGLLTIADQGAFAGVCAAWARWQRFERLAQKESPDVAIGQGYANAATKALQQFSQLLARFGLSPSDRNQVVGRAPDKPNAFAKFRRSSKSGISRTGFGA